MKLMKSAHRVLEGLPGPSLHFLQTLNNAGNARAPKCEGLLAQ